MAPFGGAVREDGVVDRSGGDRAGGDCGGSGDESIEHHEPAVRGCAEDQSSDRCDFESSESGKGVDGVSCFVKGQSAPDDVNFSDDAGIVESSASAGGF